MYSGIQALFSATPLERERVGGQVSGVRGTRSDADCGLVRGCWTPGGEADPERVKMVTLGFDTQRQGAEGREQGAGIADCGWAARSDCVRKMVTLVFRTETPLPTAQGRQVAA